MYAKDIVMKPTMAKEQPFRTNHNDSNSYFVSGHIKEDGGFALKPWTKVRFENEKITIWNIRHLPLATTILKILLEMKQRLNTALVM